MRKWWDVLHCKNRRIRGLQMKNIILKLSQWPVTTTGCYWQIQQKNSVNAITKHCKITAMALPCFHNILYYKTDSRTTTTRLLQLLCQWTSYTQQSITAMSEDMLFQWTVVCKLLSTQFTNKRSLSRVDSHVRAQVTALREAFVTHGTVAVANGSMRSHVTAESGAWLEACWAALTCHWLFSRVNTLMQVPQMIVTEGFATRRARVRTFLRVHTHVVAQQWALDESTPTDCTDVRPSISVDAFMNIEWAMLREPVSYTHLTLPTNREV